MRGVSLLVTVGLILSASPPLRSAIIHVPADSATIQGGIDGASTGDTVRVAPGTYVETIDFLGKAITVDSEWGPDSTVIDGAHSGSVVSFISSEGNDSRIDGFTLTNGRPHTGEASTAARPPRRSPTISS